jgi:hypothetical protein
VRGCGSKLRTDAGDTRSLFHGPRQNGLVTAMHAIEIADRNHAALEFARKACLTS